MPSCTLTAAAPPPKPKIVPLQIVPHPKMTMMYFKPGISQELIELFARGAAEQGSKIVGYFGLPPDGKTARLQRHSLTKSSTLGHEVGFAAHLSSRSQPLMETVKYNHKLTGNDVLLVEEGSAPASGNCTVLKSFAIPGCSENA